MSADESFALRFDDLFTEYSIRVRQDEHGHLIAFVICNVCGYLKSFNAEPSLFRNIEIFHLRVAFFTNSLRLDVAVKAAQESLPQCVLFHLFGDDGCTILLIPASLDLDKFSFMDITQLDETRKNAVVGVCKRTCLFFLVRIFRLNLVLIDISIVFIDRVDRWVSRDCLLVERVKLALLCLVEVDLEIGLEHVNNPFGLIIELLVFLSCCRFLRHYSS